jgi:hypothetical protein
MGGAGFAPRMVLEVTAISAEPHRTTVPDNRVALLLT